MRIRAVLLSVAAALAAASGRATDASKHELLYAPGESIQRRVVESDEAWMLVLLARDEVCGEMCGEVRATISSMLAKAGGLYNFAYVNAHDAILGHDGDMIEAHKEFNASAVPTMVLYPPGAKHIDTGIRMDTQAAQVRHGRVIQHAVRNQAPPSAPPPPPPSSSPPQAFLGQGAKTLYNSMGIMLTSTSTLVRSGNLHTFLTRPQPQLPRAILVTSKTDTPAMWRKMSTDFSGLAVFGQVSLEEAGGRLAAMWGLDKTAGTTLLIGPRGPFTTAQVDPAVLKNMPAGHFNSGGTASAWRKFPVAGQTLEQVRTLLDKELPAPSVPQLRSPADFRCVGSACAAHAIA